MSNQVAFADVEAGIDKSGANSLAQMSSRASMVASQVGNQRPSIAAAKKNDPYQLDFATLKKNYKKDVLRMPFVKSEFLHYCKNPQVYKSGEGGANTIITMEVVQAPKSLQYSELVDPAIAKKAEIAKRRADEKKKKEEEKAALKAEKKAAKEAEKLAKQEAKQKARDERKAERMKEREAERAERAVEKEAEKKEKEEERTRLREAREKRREEKQNKKEEKAQKKAAAKKTGINSDESDEYGDDSGSDDGESDYGDDGYGQEEADAQSDAGDDESDSNQSDDSAAEVEDQSDYDDEVSEEDVSEAEESSDYGGYGGGYGSYGTSGGSSDGYGSYGTDGTQSSGNDSYGGEDNEREYNGDMFKKSPIDYALTPTTMAGQQNNYNNTYDSTLISIWSTGGGSLRMSRLKDVMIEVPPLKKDAKFYLSHSQDAIFYLGRKSSGDPKLVLIVVSLKTLEHKIYDLKDFNPTQLGSLDGASLINKNKVLCVNLSNQVHQKGGRRMSIKPAQVQSDKWVLYDLFNQKELWHLNGVVKLFFKSKEPSDEAQDSEEQVSDEEKEDKSEHSDGDNLPKNAYAMTISYEQVEVSNQNEDDLNAQAKAEESKDKKKGKSKDKEEDTKVKKEDHKIWRLRKVPWGTENVLECKIKWETFIEKKHLKKHTEQEEEKARGKDIAETIAARIAAQALMVQTIVGEERVVQHDDSETSYAHDWNMHHFVIVHHGKNGEQHIIKQFFNKEIGKGQVGPEITMYKPGNTEVFLSLNGFAREAEEIFLITWSKNGVTQSKNLVISKDDLDEQVTLTQQDVELTACKDVFIDTQEDDKTAVISICSSSKDEYLNVEASYVKYISKEYKGKITSISCKLRAQEIKMNYPGLVSNVGSRKIMVQSVSQPNCHATFSLQDSDFIAFADFSNLQDIGFLDKRSTQQKQLCNFEELGTRIAFLSRALDACGKKGNCEEGDMLLNILQVDTYAQPMTFQLYTTDYEACMQEGARRDILHSAYVTKVNTARGIDTTLALQYNDGVIFDCITSTIQPPLLCPVNKLTENDDDMEVAEHQFMDPKKVKMVKVKMQMDPEGAIYWLVEMGSGRVCILRHNPGVEMGDSSFFQKVFELRTDLIYFFLISDGKFYVMDSAKKVRVLVQDTITKKLHQEGVFELGKKDKQQLVHTSFDEYSISSGCLHWDSKMFFLLDSSSRDNATWASEDVMLDGYKYINGPVNCNGTDSVFYVQRYKPAHAKLLKEEASDDEIVEQEQGGHQIMVCPMGDRSYTDILPKTNVNNKNFISYISNNHILAHFSNRYLVFNNRGHFLDEVSFEKQPKTVKKGSLSLVCVSDDMQYFIFQGSHKDQKEKPGDKKGGKSGKTPKTGGPNGGILAGMKGALKKKAKKEPVPEKKSELVHGANAKKEVHYFAFRLVVQTDFITGISKWEFVYMQIDIKKPEQQDPTRKFTIQINSEGRFDQSRITDVYDSELEAVTLLTVQIRSSECQKQDQQLAFDTTSTSFGAQLLGLAEKKNYREEQYRFDFTYQNRVNVMANLEKGLKQIDAKIRNGSKNQGEYRRMKQRRNAIEKTWCLGDYLIAKCGTEIAYVKRSKQILQVKATVPRHFDVQLGDQVWLEGIYSTGIEDLVQLFVIDELKFLVYIITWNLDLNREHTIYQTKFVPGTFPETYFIQLLGNPAHNFNLMLQEGGLINLEHNLPCQIFDKQSEGNMLPTGLYNNIVPGQKRVSTDKLQYLDVTWPGRQHHFCSFVDLLYWERFQNDRSNHELTRGKITRFSPYYRVPNGVSIFHFFATNIKVLRSVTDAVQLYQNDKPYDPCGQLIPLLILHRHPLKNKQGIHATPLHVALEKQSPISFETMLELLCEEKKVFITKALLDRLDDIIDAESPIVNEFLNKSFFITDQFDGPRPLKWSGDDKEKIIALPTAYLTDEVLQSLVDKGDAESDEENEEEVKSASFDDSFIKASASSIEVIAVEKQEDSRLKQVEAKILDFDWVFNGDNAARFIHILTETDNDEVFACDQVRVFVDFMWQGYFDAIFNSLFVPFIFYFSSFILYATYFAHRSDANYYSFAFVGELITLVVWGKTFVTFFLLEVIQFRGDPKGYFTNFWNLLDFFSICLCSTYMICQLTGTMEEDPLNILGAFAVFMLYFKLFYWMRLFKPFSAFIRVLTEIAKDIKVFSIMLLLCLAAFANVLTVINVNRTASSNSPIYEEHLGFGPLDALIHSYLTGLGEFGMDDYSEFDAKTVWFFFIFATILIQLVFMNMLIAIMGESFGRITAIQQQSTLKELANMMNDHIWLLRISEVYKNKRYILWLAPDTAKSAGTLVERQLSQLKEYVEERADASDQKISRLDEKVSAMNPMLEGLEKILVKAHGNAESDDSDAY